MRTGVLLAGLLVALPGQLLGGCGGVDPTSDLEGSWVLTEMSIDGQEPFELPEEYRPTLEYDGGRAHGFAGCNTYSAPVDEDGGNLVIGPAEQTLMGCSSTPGRIEEAYLWAIRAVTDTSLDDGALVLTGEGVSMMFQASGEGGVER